MKRLRKQRSPYHDECPVFEVVSLRATGAQTLKIGQHVEAAGPCCIGTDRAWKCGVLMLNGQRFEEDLYIWVRNLRPLTAAAREMLRLVEGR